MDQQCQWQCHVSNNEVWFSIACFSVSANDPPICSPGMSTLSWDFNWSKMSCWLFCSPKYLSDHLRKSKISLTNVECMLTRKQSCDNVTEVRRDQTSFRAKNVSFLQLILLSSSKLVWDSEGLVLAHVLEVWNTFRWNAARKCLYFGNLRLLSEFYSQQPISVKACNYRQWKQSELYLCTILPSRILSFQSLRTSFNSAFRSTTMNVGYQWQIHVRWNVNDCTKCLFPVDWLHFQKD